MAPRPEKCAIDHTRFGYAVAKSLTEMEMGYREASKISGLSTRQISAAVNGEPIGAGSTIILAIFCGIDLEELFSGDARKRLRDVISVYDNVGQVAPLANELVARKQAVTPNVARETSECAR